MKTPPRRSSSAARSAATETAPALENTNVPQASPVGDYLKIAGVLIGIGAVALAGLSFYRGRESSHRAEATGELLFATQTEDAEQFNTVGERYDDTTAGLWSTAVAADSYLSQGVDALYIDRQKEAPELLDAAIRNYRKVLDRKPSGMLEVRATYGLAQALEAKGDLTDAAEQYEKVANHEAASKELKEEAAKRSTYVTKSDAKDFYEWFASQQPVVPTTKPPSGSEALEMLPDSPDIRMPSVSTPPPVAPPTDAPAPPAPDAPAEKPADPAGEKPADTPAEKPAEPASEKPAEPAAEKPAEPAAEKPAEPATEKPAETPAETPPEKPAEPTAEKPAEPAAEKPAEEKPADAPASESAN